MSDQLGDPTAVAQSLLTLGRALLAEGDPTRALGLFDEADAIASAAGAPRLVGMARFNAGYLELERGDYVSARERFESARAQFTAVNNTYGVARTLAGLGAVALHEGRSDDAVAPLRESIELASSMGDRENMVWAARAARCRTRGVGRRARRSAARSGRGAARGAREQARGDRAGAARARGRRARLA